MSCSPPCSNSSPRLDRASRWSEFWFRNNNNNNNNNKSKALNNVLLAMHLQSLPKSTRSSPTKTTHFTHPIQFVADRTSLLSDQLMLQILSRVPLSQRNSNSLVSKRWLNLQGRLVRSLKLLDWDFLVSGRLFIRFPNLTHVDLVSGGVISSRKSGVLLTQNKFVSLHFDSSVVCSNRLLPEECLLSVDEIDSGLRVLANGYPNLRRLGVVNASEMGLLSVAEECPTLQELELHRCNDQVLRGIAAFVNLQVLKLIANVDGFYNSLVSDIGLTILAQGCKRLVKLELSGCEGSFDGIKAIGQCCQMLEELTLCDHKMDDGWLSALSYCENLKTLRFLSCKRIDLSPGPDEHLGCCPTLERLHLEKCQLRDKRSLRALFLVCQAVRELVFQKCWGLDDDMFGIAYVCRRVRSLSIEVCSLLTAGGLESVILSWNELQSLKVISCKNLKDSEVTPALSALFYDLKDLSWRSDSQPLLSACLAGTGMKRKGGKFKKS